MGRQKAKLDFNFGASMRYAKNFFHSEKLGKPERVRPVGGGDICEAFCVEAGGKRYFVKEKEEAPSGFFAAEARGLRVLKEAVPQLCIPTVLDVGARHLVLSWLQETPSTRSAEITLAEGLAQLHGHQPGSMRRANTEATSAEARNTEVESAAPLFVTASQQNYVGTLQQQSSAALLQGEPYAAFFFRRRLLPHLSELCNLHHGGELASEFQLLRSKLSEPSDEFGFSEQPLCLVHGDLWGGNWMNTAAGPALFDPAITLGPAEVDLTMMQLFGGFSPHVFEIYESLLPATPGRKQRITLLSVYPLLIHARLFGGSYFEQAKSRVRSVLQGRSKR